VAQEVKSADAPPKAQENPSVKEFTDLNNFRLSRRPGAIGQIRIPGNFFLNSRYACGFRLPPLLWCMIKAGEETCTTDDPMKGETTR
jgi:hypothetical protein